MLAALLTRNFTLDDVPSGLRLCRLSGWNQVEEDWLTFLKLGENACRVIESDGTVVGTVATLSFAQGFSWIAMILVDPAMRGRGIGTDLIQEALTILKDEQCIGLDATEAGGRIYRNHGFKEEYRINRLVAKAPSKFFCIEGNACRPICDDDLEDIFALDKEVYGADRSGLLRSLFARNPEYAWMSRIGRTAGGYVFGRHGYHHEHVGPLVAGSETIARELFSCCAARGEGRSLVVDVPDDFKNWTRWLEDAGFAMERSFARMYRGSRKQPEDTSWQYAITGPEFG
jgi:GNAT superfamily N-acetyltransferase